MKLIFLDTETTGREIDDRLLQLAYRTTDDAADVNKLYKPECKIKIEAMAIHHITEKDVSECDKFASSVEYEDLRERFDNDEVLIAHNAKFDIDFLMREGLPMPKFIDTFKVAHHLDSEGRIPSYSLQYLRYFLEIEVVANPHDAMGDVLVLERLFYRQLKKIMETRNIGQDTAIEQMIDISNDPLIFKFFPFGKHKNKSIEEVAKQDPGYLRWLLEQKEAEDSKDADWIATIKKHLHL